jgi:protein-tyrosine phosphatase/membrane-associated phospholipid phosphatase
LTVRAAVTAVALSVLFVVVYGATNWFTAQRSDVGTWYFPWELAVISYVPLLIVPYMSIDLFFFAAPFLCRDGRELGTFTRRVIFSILVAAAFFLLLPLRLVWQRPRLEGGFGNFVEASCTVPYLMAYPHNLFPSLHIALRTILADIYARHTRGVARLLALVWFSLIGFSTVLTYQHHLVDIAGGFVLAGFAFYLFPKTRVRLPVVPNIRIGCYYAAGAAGVLALVPAVWPWGAFLLWPAAGLGIVAAAYFGIGPGIYQKTDGSLPLSARFVFAPVLVGQYSSLLYYRGQCRPWDEVSPGLWIGRTLTDAEAATAIKQGVTAVLDLTAEFAEAAPFRATNYRNLPVLDLTAPTPDQLREAVQFITKESARGTVYVHCKIGYSRSAAVVGAYLLNSRRAAMAQKAIDLLRKARPSIIIRPEAREALRAFERSE